MERDVAHLVLKSIDEVWERQRGRFEGLTQEEYLWEPAPGCWSVSQVDGRWVVPPRVDPDPGPAPITTVAWRLWHIGPDCLGSYLRGGLGEWPLEVHDVEWYERVDDALAAVDRCWDAFRTGLGRLGDEGMWRPLGEAWGPFAPEPWAALVLHAQDELAHHGAEIGLLRDLWSRLRPS